MKLLHRAHGPEAEFLRILGKSAARPALGEIGVEQEYRYRVLGERADFRRLIANVPIAGSGQPSPNGGASASTLTPTPTPKPAAGPAGQTTPSTPATAGGGASPAPSAVTPAPTATATATQPPSPTSTPPSATTATSIPNAPPQVASIVVTFAAPVTTYTINVTDAEGDALAYAWQIAGETCGTPKSPGSLGSGKSVVWSHSSASPDDCAHAGTNHPVTVTVTVFEAGVARLVCVVLGTEAHTVGPGACQKVD